MDVNQINSVTELKALAYDQTLAAERAQQNLAIIRNRIRQLEAIVAGADEKKADSE